MNAKMVKTVDRDRLPKHFEAKEAERRWDDAWAATGVHRFDPDRPREETFVVDTPPPTVSGSLHVGHVFSYTQTDVVVRYQRMRGRNIFYPMGWDDNGLPTERRVQNYYHVRCDPAAQPDPTFKRAPASAKDRKGPPKVVSRPDFIRLCTELTAEDEQAFKGLWQRVGLSVDWTLEYSTISEHSRRTAQQSFLSLFQRGEVYSAERPMMWDVDFQTAVAQAEVEDRPKAGAFHDIRFEAEDSNDSFVISTTRPELLPACVGVAAHPEDSRYQHLLGKHAVTPLFGATVPIFSSESVEPDKGTGILMVCTFGDATDVAWWQEQRLPLRQVLGREGRLRAVRFGDAGWESKDPDKANAYYAKLERLKAEPARKAIVELLRDPAASSKGAALQGEPRPVQQSVKHFEKGDKPLELIPTRQWFVRLMDKKEQLIRMGEAIQWHPEFMGRRYCDWTDNLQLDWCVSRQRYFGVPIPVWYPVNADGEAAFDKPIVAQPDQLPVDPSTDVPTGYSPEQRGCPNGFVGEQDVFDTWFTSSLTPQIAAHESMDPGQSSWIPMDIRPQSHDIIRTWAFYTIAQSMLHHNTVPWTHALISGWILDPDRKKMSKSKGNVVVPVHLLDQYTADGTRYWAASARLGTDTAFDERVFKIGKRLVTKLFNAGKFVLSQSGPVGPITRELDRAFVHQLRGLVASCTTAYEEFDYARALRETEQFFWASFTDSFLELTKKRARDSEDSEGQASAVATLRLGLSVLLRLFAPVLPYITEEVWSWVFAQETRHPTIHQAPWPSEEDFMRVSPPSQPDSFVVAVQAFGALNKKKSELGMSTARGFEQARLGGSVNEVEVLKGVCDDLRIASGTERLDLEAQQDLDSFVVIEAAPWAPEAVES